MRLNLQLFGDTSKSGSSGSAGRNAITKKQYNAYMDEWRELSNKESSRVGVYELFRELEKKNGGPLGSEKTSVQLNMRTPLGKVMNEIYKSGGSENFKVIKDKWFLNAESNRAGLEWLTKYLRRYRKLHGNWW